ncbi:MAG: AAA family ATPase, partial [Planctomycetia bacterium]|nr:AAA family ATPase [Planctomycetia bacterium]
RYKGGYHDFAIAHGRTEVFPRLVAAEHPSGFERGQLKSGIKEFDKLVGGGIELGTSVLLLGPSGVGKSSLAIQFARAVAERGDRAIMFSFDESLETMRQRTSGLGMPIDGHLASGLFMVQSVDPAELSPGEFAHLVRRSVEGKGDEAGAKVVIIDSLNGYLNAMPEERFLSIQLHELLTFLGHMGVVTFVVVAQHGVLGSVMATPLDTSYLADSVILFRYFESRGEVKQALSVVKKRSGAHERTIREYTMGATGIQVGEPLRNLHGVLTGTPSFYPRHADSPGKDEG